MSFINKLYVIALTAACISLAVVNSRVRNSLDDECKKNEFQCLNGICIPKKSICDGTENCPDGSDVSPTFCVNQYCPVGKFKCNNSNRCISEYRVCDGSNDCEDNSDEEQSMCLKRPCLFNSLVKCQDNGKCIHKGYLCDTVNDCDDGSDEKDCTDYQLPPVPSE